ncbi:MAG: FixH family protein, partial [Pseudomonadota bacterium]
IPWYFVAFFVVVVILDAIFVTIATSTHRGVVTELAYEKGLAYNTTIAAFDAQERLGWQADIRYIQPQVRFTLFDASGAPIDGARVVAHFTRVTQAGHDFHTPLVARGAGVYNGDVILPLSGQWRIGVSVKWKQQHYQKSKLIVTK